MKQCSRCKEYLPVEMFGINRSTRSGLNPSCKHCISEKNAKYNSLNKESTRLRNKRYYERNREAILVSTSEYVKRNRRKEIAKHRLFSALRNGSIKKPGWCCVCGVIGEKIDGHHFDYSLPLSVIWCCRQCHRIMHKKHYTGKEWSNG